MTLRPVHGNLNIIMGSARIHSRVETIKPVYLLRQAAAGEFAVSLNISKLGVCVLTSHDLALGQEVVLYSKFLWPDKMNAVVRWCTNVKGNFRRAGLSLSPAA